MDDVFKYLFLVLANLLENNMKALLIAALITSFSIGSSVFARDHENPGEGTQGIGTECWMDWDRGGAIEVCGTIFESVVVPDDSPRGE